MPGSRGGRDVFSNFGDPFAGFDDFGSIGNIGAFGAPGSLMSTIFGGRNPFDDPFFNRPFGGMFESGFFDPGESLFMGMHTPRFVQQQAPEPRRSGGIIIEEINSDDEKEQSNEENNRNPRKHGRSSSESYVQVPDEEIEGRNNREVQIVNGYSRNSNIHAQPQQRSFSFQSSTVTYGGANGAYYTSSKMRRTGSDGLTFEESRQADSTTREATHRVSRGLHNKGHSVARRLNSDGSVETRQALHNLNEDELDGFEREWDGNAQRHLPGWSGSFRGSTGAGSSGTSGQGSQGVRALPSTKPAYHSGRVMRDAKERPSSSRPNSLAARMRTADMSSDSRGKAMN